MLTGPTTLKSLVLFIVAVLYLGLPAPASYALGYVLAGDEAASIEATDFAAYGLPRSLR